MKLYYVSSCRRRLETCVVRRQELFKTSRCRLDHLDDSNGHRMLRSTTRMLLFQVHFTRMIQISLYISGTYRGRLRPTIDAVLIRGGGIKNRRLLNPKLSPIPSIPDGWVHWGLSSWQCSRAKGVSRSTTSCGISSYQRRESPWCITTC